MIHIVTHCYAARLPQYAVFLRYQIASLRLHPPSTDYKISICMVPDDDATMKVLRDLNKADADIDVICLSEHELFRRAIGRNIVAKSSHADILWFTDVDHVFGHGCLDAVALAWETRSENALMIYPRLSSICRTHTIGDWYVDHVDETNEDILPSDFVPKKQRRAIGGIQIADGQWCRKHGYLDGTKWQRPRTDGKPFADFKDDIQFRNAICKEGTIESFPQLLTLYRLRHSQKTY